MSKRKHPWKICHAGSYYVKGHNKVINGKKYFWNAHCRKGNSKKEILTVDEIQEISQNFKKEKLKMPKTFDFDTVKGLGNKYDLTIAGWVKYWSETFNIKSNITVDFVKVLIMSESSFQNKAKANIKNTNYQALGLMQITDYTFNLIKEDQKELRNHVFNIKRKDLLDPNVNICVGVRWIFRKRVIAKYFLKKEPTQLQLAEEYKGIRNDKSLAAKEQRRIFKEKLQKYKEAKIKK